MRVIIGSWGHKVAIEVGLKESVVEIKTKIEQLLGVPVASQTLAVCGLELLDGLDMEDYPIVTEGTKIDLTIRYWMAPPNFYHSGKIQIIIKFSARQLHIEVDRTETVRSLKEKIHIMDGTPIKRMSLFFCGIELEEDFRHLSEYGIQEFSEIVVFLKSMSRVKDDPPSKRLSLVVQTSSSLLNSARIPVEMKDSSTVNELKELLLSGKILPVETICSYTSRGSCVKIAASNGMVLMMGISYTSLKGLFVVLDTYQSYARRIELSAMAGNLN